MSAIPAGEITRLLSANRQGSADALDRLMVLMYPSLRSMAAALMTGERRNHTLEPAALVHEAVLRLFLRSRAPARDRRHLMGLAGLQMRRILVDHARRHDAERWREDEARRRGEARDSFHSIVMLDGLLEQLREVDSRAAAIVELCFFAGISKAEVAEELGVAVRTVQRDWEFARAWLSDAMKGR